MTNSLATPEKPEKQRPFFFYWLALLCIAVYYPQLPLYSSNQNTYFLHGLAHSRSSPLQADWLAQTADPTPLFSLLVSATVSALHPNFFYLFQVVLVSIFLFSCLGVASWQKKVPLFSLHHLLLLLCTVLIYSGLYYRLIPNTPWTGEIHEFIHPDGYLVKGLAFQYALGTMFQPSVFAVFIALSIYLFIREKTVQAVICLAVASNFHPTYLLSCLFFFLAYLVVMVREGTPPKRYLGLAALFLLLHLPLLWYLSSHFSATSTELMEASRKILYEYRIPHHANPRIWFTQYSAIQIGLMLLSLVLVRGIKLATVLGIPFLLAASLTILQVATGSMSLGLLFPWRVSVILVPLATFILISCGIDFALNRLGNVPKQTQAVVGTLTLLLISINAVYGIRKLDKLFHPAPLKPDSLYRVVRDNYQPGDLYLTPANLDDFRIAAETPILVDQKSHPYRDFELVEWYKRVKLSKQFYHLDAPSGCPILSQASKEYGLTHVVVNRDYPISQCQILTEIYHTRKYRICRIRR